MPFVVADYVIRTAADVENWQDNVNCGDGGTYVVLANDIDCASVQNYAGKATTWYGVFDGYGHAISNLTINTTTITYYSEVVPCATFIGRYGRAGSVVRDFALVNVTYNLSNGAYDSTAGIIGHMEAGLIENCFVSGRVEEYTGTWRKGGYLGGQLNGNIKNVVVIDLSDPSTAVPVVGHMDNDNNTTNVLAVTNGNVLANGLGGITQITKVSPEGDIASAFESFIASAGAESGFSYDEETGWLSLWNTQVYKIAKEYTLEVQFADNEDITFTTEKTVTAVKVDGTAVSFTQEGDVVRITSAIADGRHTLVMGADGDNYTMPFVVADYVIRTAADVENWNKSAVSGITGGSPEEYVVLANNIDCTDVVYAPTYTNFYGVFDGYGHALTNLVVGTTNLGGTRTSSSFIGGTLYGSVKDLALVNVHFNLIDGMYDAETGLCGRLERGLIENCYVSGIVTKSGTCRRAGLISALEAGGTVRNCIVDASKQVQFDNFYAVGINGDNATTPYSTTFENVLAIAPAGVLINKADNANITAVSPTDGTATAIQEFITKAGENSAFSFDEATKTLKLWDTAVYSSLDV